MYSLLRKTDVVELDNAEKMLITQILNDSFRICVRAYTEQMSGPALSPAVCTSANVP